MGEAARLGLAVPSPFTPPSVPPGYAFSYIVGKSADQTVTGSTVLVDDDSLFLPIGNSATETWFFEFILYVLAANTTMDFKCGFTAPAGASMRWGIQGSAGVGVNGWGVQTTGSTPSGLAESVGGPISVGTTAGVSQGMSFGGWVFGGGTAGNVRFQWAQATSDGGNLVVKKGSFLRAIKVTV